MKNVYLKIDKRQGYPAMDVIKFILANCVVAAHVNLLYQCPFEWLDKFLNVFFHMTVPFFFISSSFFLFYKFIRSEKDGQYDFSIITTCIKKYIKLYLIWTLINTPLALYGAHKYNYTPKKTILVYIQGLFFTGENFYSWALWYMLSSIVALTLVLIFLKLKLSPATILITGISFSLFGRILDILHFTENLPAFIEIPVKAYFHVFFYTRNGFFIGTMYVCIGYFLAYKCIKGFNLPVVPLAIGSAIAFVVSYITVFDNEVHRLYETLPIHFSTAYLVTMIFLICLNFPGQPSTLHALLREESKVVYYVHLLYYSLYSFVLIKFIGEGFSKPIVFLLVMSLSLLTGLFVFYCKKNKKFKIINEIF